MVLKIRWPVLISANLSHKFYAQAKSPKAYFRAFCFVVLRLRAYSLLTCCLLAGAGRAAALATAWGITRIAAG
jgi:hypothetical protein